MVKKPNQSIISLSLALGKIEKFQFPKLKSIEYAKANNNKLAAEKFGVSTKSIRQWRKNEI